MSRAGMRVTEQRKSLARLFTRAGKSLTPKDVYEYMDKQYPGLSFDTVYRNLRIWHEMGILEQFILEDGVKFKLRCAEDRHHHHLICLECEKTYSLDFCPMQVVPDLPEHFEVINHKFELYGYCRECREASSGTDQGKASGHHGQKSV